MNVSEFISRQAELNPNKKAIVELAKKSLFSFGGNNQNACTFDELEKKINILCNALTQASFKEKDKVLVFIPPSIDLICYTFCFFKMGLVPVFIDPGMGKEKLLECIEKVEADGLIGISKIFYLKKINAKSFSSVKKSICTDSNLWGDNSLAKLKKDASNSYDGLKRKPSDLAGILFTSGATGTPKGVEYRVEMFVQQVMSLKRAFSINSTDNDFSGFPLFSLFTLCMGATTYIPASVDPKAPSSANPSLLVRELKENKITIATGSPSIWANLIKYCEKKKIKLDDMKSLIMFGAPVSGTLIKKLVRIMPQARVYTPYGATESLPLSIIDSQLILGETFELTEMGKGVCVGYPVDKVHTAIIEMSEKAEDKLKELPVGEIGEICVSSPTTSHGYHQHPNNALSKIKDKSKIWHRMGDVGYQDDWGRLWYLGRKTHVIKKDGKNHYSVSVEGIFNSHQDVERSALIRVDDAPAVALILKNKSKFLSANEKEELRRKLSLFSQRFEDTKEIKRFEFIDEFPLDSRHNIKIDRLKLGESFQ